MPDFQKNADPKMATEKRAERKWMRLYTRTTNFQLYIIITPNQKLPKFRKSCKFDQNFENLAIDENEAAANRNSGNANNAPKNSSPLLKNFKIEFATHKHRRFRIFRLLKLLFTFFEICVGSPPPGKFTKFSGETPLDLPWAVAMAA